MIGLGLLGVWPQSLSVASVAGDLSHVFCFFFFWVSFGQQQLQILLADNCKLELCEFVFSNLG